MTSDRPAAPAKTTGRVRLASQPAPPRRTRAEPVSLLHPEARRLARAAADLDADLVFQIVQASIGAIGVVPTWEQFVQPVWQYLCSRTDDNGERSASELVYVQSAMAALSAARRPPRPSPPTVLLACADEELQAFPLEALVAALEESGVACCVLGARVPPDALASAAARLRPTVVIIWSQSPQTADPAQIVTVLEAHPVTTIVAAGPGWNAANLPGQAVRPEDLSTALVLTLAGLEAHTALRTQPG